MRSFFTKKRSLVALAAVAVLAIAGGAYAYFTSTGSGSTNATVGSSSPWGVSLGPVSGPALVPDHAVTVTISQLGAPSVPPADTPDSNVQSVPFTVTNSSSAGSQNLNAVSVAISPASLPQGCTASDFSVDGAAPGLTAVDNSLDGDFVGGQSKNGVATIEMIDNTNNQDACQHATPLLTLNAS